MEIERKIDAEDELRQIMTGHVKTYSRPLPASYQLPHAEVSVVGGTEGEKIDTFDLLINIRAETEAEASETMRNYLAIAKKEIESQKTAFATFAVNSQWSWGRDASRPDLALCQARVIVKAHPEEINI